MTNAMFWAISGVVLILLEVVSQSFVLCFFGVGALLVALFARIGLLPGAYSQLLVFAVTSLLMVWLLRKYVKRFFPGTKDMPPDYLGQVVRVSKAIPPGEEGAVSHRGSDWIAFSDNKEVIPVDSKVELISMDGIRFNVKRVQNPETQGGIAL